MPEPRKQIISFEGSEGCGKSTQIDLTLEWLKSKQIPVVLCREPGGTPLGEAIRHLLKHDVAGQDMHPLSELFLFAASRAELVQKVIRPALSGGQWILCDRFLDSTTIYQGWARGLGVDVTGPLNQLAIAGHLPGLTLVLDLDPVVALDRVRARGRDVPDRMESEPTEFYQQVRDGYLHLADEEPERVKIIDAAQPPDQVFSLIKQELQDAFPSLMD